MKYLIALCTCFLFLINKTSAQDKIVISYDDNGNRILRERICPTCRPAPPNEQSQGNSQSLDVASQGIEASKSRSIKVFPNPSRNYFNIVVDLASLKGTCELILTDQFGRELQRAKITRTQTQISTAELADGVYYINVIRGVKKDVVKLVKESSH